MAKGTNQKLKLLYLAQIFSEETDEDHGLTLAEIAQRLSRLDINAERKTLYQDFEELRRFGMDICTNQEGKSFRYFLGSRTFQLPELKLLVDAVQSSRFITEQKSRELIKKLETLTSRSNANQLQRQVLIAGRIKTMNESIYYNVDGLHTAIAKGRQIQFRYFRWGPDKTMILRHNGELYTVSPWHLCWDDENYYLVAYDSASGRIKHYRVDKMKNITITDLPRDGAETMEHLDLTIYTRRLFGMFGGEPIRVTLEGDDDMINVLIDRFGDEIPLSRKDGDRVETRVDVAVSPQFLGWVASFGGKLTVTSPPSVKEQMRTLARKLSEQYE